MVKGKKRSGFSMIEVLVASTIMIMIVMMLGTLFQQTSQAWRTGRQRADSLLKARALFGILQKDMSTAIDIKTLPKALETELKTLDGELTQKFDGNEIRFFTLTGTGYDRDAKASDGKPPLRSLTHVTYNRGDGTRKEIKLIAVDGGGFEKAFEQNAAQLLSASMGGQSLNISSWRFSLDGNLVNTVPSTRFPDYIMINANALATSSTYEVGAGSAGPDKEWGTRDDIKTWTDK